jgi:gas vesicle protein
MNSRTSWYMLGAGLVAGATVALLYAPQSGYQSRRALRKKGTRIFNEVEAGSSRAYDKTKSVMRRVQKLGGSCLAEMSEPVNVLRRVASK